MSKRVFDIFFVLVAGVPILFVLLFVAVLARVFQGSPVLYSSNRAGLNCATFRLRKVRTMTADQDDDRVFAGDSISLVTPLGYWLRRTRLDELPQFWHVLTGEMSLVGPRPPLERIAREHADIYREVLRDRPGVTGLATVVVCGWEERVMSGSMTAASSDKLYTRRCIPRKMRIDRIYHSRQSRTLDLYVIYLTLARVLRLPGRRAGRIYRDRIKNQKTRDAVSPAPPLPFPTSAAKDASPPVRMSSGPAE